MLPTYLYEAYDEAGVLLYVGVTSDVRSRVAAHATEKAWWVKEVTDLKVRTYKTPALALKAERETIESRHPKYNVTHSAINKPRPPIDRKTPPSAADGPSFEVHVERGETYWIVRVPAVDRVTQARNLREVQPMARDLISIMTGREPDSFGVTVLYELPESIENHMKEAERLRGVAQEAQSTAARETRLAAATLHKDGIPLRDIGTLLGVSHQRAHQLVSEA